MTKSAFGAVYSEIDGTPHPVVDTAGLCALRLWLSPLAIELEARPGRAADEGAGDVFDVVLAREPAGEDRRTARRQNLAGYLNHGCELPTEGGPRNLQLIARRTVSSLDLHAFVR